MLFTFRAFWRTCSFMLGAALNRAFKPEANLQLHSFPGPNSKQNHFLGFKIRIFFLLGFVFPPFNWMKIS